MKKNNFLIEVGRNISYINEEMMSYKFELRDYKKYYKNIIKNLNELINTYNEIFSNLSKRGLNSELKKQVMRCEIEAWKIYCSFMKNKVEESLRHFILLIKSGKRSDYKRCSESIDSIKMDIQSKSNTMDIKEILEKYRLLGEKYKELDSEKVIKNWILFWVVVGVIIAFLTLILK